MIVVSDSSPVLALAAIGQLDLLRLLFADVIMPEAVDHEIAQKNPARVAGGQAARSPVGGQTAAR